MIESISKKLQKLKEISSFNAKIAARYLGFLGGYSDYSKFIILGKGRSGSTLLSGLLNSHSQVIAYGELFRKPDAIGWDLPPYDKYLQKPSLISLVNQDPVAFVSRKVFNKYSKTIASVGFKLFYYHAHDDSRQKIWPFLQEQTDIKILHIKRKNTLQELLSLRRAFKTNQWANTTGDTEKQLSISLDYEDCLQEFTYAQKSKDRFDAFFQDHPKIDVIYEDLANDYESEMRRIQDFLEVNYEPVTPSTFKQSNQTLMEAITNYTELKQQFSNTPWYSYFEE